MRNYALSLIIHVAGIVMLAVGGRGRIRRHTKSMVLRHSMWNNHHRYLYQPLPYTDPANCHDAANRGMHEE